jgi:hypothetical protein
VTASALLDLVSQEWLERLIVETGARRLPVYAALSYDGQILLDPATPHDADIVAAFNRHQRTNKGFGEALGPDAATRAAAGFQRIGYAVTSGQSDWDLGPGDATIQREVLAGFVGAVRDDLPGERIADWLTERDHLIRTGRSRLRVGHVDFFALPMPIR